MPTRAHEDDERKNAEPVEPTGRPDAEILSEIRAILVRLHLDIRGRDREIKAALALMALHRIVNVADS